MFRTRLKFNLVIASFTFLFSSSLFAAPESGLAAVYSNRLHGHKTACGSIYNKNKLTTAHQTLPCGTQVKITNPKTGKHVVLKVTDRGPTQAGRIVDISRLAAKKLGMRPSAMIPVELEVVSK
jgi:rare lipoprotein A